MWCAADREGRFEWKPRELKLICLPWWDGDFSRVLDALVTRGLLVRYALPTGVFGVVRNFRKHQCVNGKEPASVLPEPPKECLKKPVTSERVVDASPTRDERVPHALFPFPSHSLPIPAPIPDPDPASCDELPTEPPRAKPKRAKTTSWRRVPETWQPNDEHWVLAVELRVSVDAELPKFRDHEFAKPKTDPDACFRTWLRNAASFPSGGPALGFRNSTTGLLGGSKPPLRQAPNPHFDLEATVDHQWDHLDAADNRG
jgi:hypothetical protein